MADEDDSDELVQVSHMVPETIRDRATAKTEHGGISEAVRETYRILAEGGNVSNVRLEMQLSKVKTDRARIEEKIDQLHDELEHLRDREDHLEDRVEERADDEDEYDALLEDLEACIHNGERIFPEHGTVQEAAEVSGQTPAEVIDEVQTQNPEVPDKAFREKRGPTDTWHGTDS